MTRQETIELLFSTGGRVPGHLGSFANPCRLLECADSSGMPTSEQSSHAMVVAIRGM